MITRLDDAKARMQHSVERVVKLVDRKFPDRFPGDIKQYPGSEGEAFESKPYIRPDKPDKQPMVVLIADDEALVLQAVGRWLELAGKPWRGAKTLSEAASILASENVEKVVLDWVWQEGPALILAKMLDLRLIPYVVYSGYPRARLIELGLPEHALVIEKPGIHELKAWLGV